MRTRFTPAHRGGSGEPMVLLHGFTDTWRTWDHVLPLLEPHHDVLAPALAGHAGGPNVDVADIEDDGRLADEVERAMDAAGFETAHIVGNSLGAYVALHLAERGRARSVVALAPAGGWPLDDRASFEATRKLFLSMQRRLVVAAPFASLIASTKAGRAYAMRDIASHAAHATPDLVAHQIRGARACRLARPLLARADEVGWQVDAEKITCPVRVVWGTADRILPYPVAAHRFRSEWLPEADWLELDGVGHCPQLDDPQAVARTVLEFAATASVGASEPHPLPSAP